MSWDDLDGFRAVFADLDHRRSQGHKRAAHVVMSRLLSPQSLAGPDFATRLCELLMGSEDYTEVGLTGAEAEQARMLFKDSGLATFRRALGNLAGGQSVFARIMRAVDFGLSAPLQTAFARLVQDGRPLAQRVDDFREDLGAGIGKSLSVEGGYEAHGTPFRVSLRFVAAILGTFDPTHYTLYSAQSIDAAMRTFRVDAPLRPAGQRYAVICQFMRALTESLQTRGVPVVDLIDTQSLVEARFIPIYIPAPR